MPQRFVRQPDGKLAVFSTIVDSFVEGGLDPSFSTVAKILAGLGRGWADLEPPA